ncbi:MAG: hypothetical protein Q9165_001040 [Trypethelium subeluteriae]
MNTYFEKTIACIAELDGLVEELKAKAEPADTGVLGMTKMLHTKAKAMGDVIKSTNVIREQLDVERSEIKEYRKEMERELSALRTMISNCQQEKSLHKASVTRLHDENKDLRLQISSLREDLRDSQDSNKQLNQKLNENEKELVNAESAALAHTIDQTKWGLTMYMKELVRDTRRFAEERLKAELAIEEHTRLRNAPTENTINVPRDHPERLFTDHLHSSKDQLDPTPSGTKRLPTEEAPSEAMRPGVKRVAKPLAEGFRIDVGLIRELPQEIQHRLTPETIKIIEEKASREARMRSVQTNSRTRRICFYMQCVANKAKSSSQWKNKEGSCDHCSQAGRQCFFFLDERTILLASGVEENSPNVDDDAELYE